MKMPVSYQVYDLQNVFSFWKLFSATLDVLHSPLNRLYFLYF